MKRLRVWDDVLIDEGKGEWRGIVTRVLGQDMVEVRDRGGALWKVRAEHCTVFRRPRRPRNIKVDSKTLMEQWREATYGVRILGNGTRVVSGENGEEYRLYPAASIWHGGDNMYALNTGYALAYSFGDDIIVVALWWSGRQPTWTSIAWRSTVKDSENIIRCARSLLSAGPNE